MVRYFQVASLLIASLLSTSLLAQNISEDDGGTSSIIMPVGNLSINTKDSKLKLGYVNGVSSGAAIVKNIDSTGFAVKTTYLTALDTVALSNRFIVGAYIWGKNEEGLAELANDGEFTPGTGGELDLGFKFYPRWGDNNFKRFKEIEKCSDDLKFVMDSATKDIADFYLDIKLFKDIAMSLETDYRDKSLKISASDTQFVDTLIKKLKYIEENVNVVHASTLLAGFQAFVKTSSTQSPALCIQTQNALFAMDVIISANSEKRAKNLSYYRDRTLKSHNSILENIDSIKAHGSDYMTFYVRGTFDKREFTIYTPGASTLSAKYLDSSFVGYSLSANLNYLMPEEHFIMGFSIGYERFDTYDNMKSRKIEATTTVYSDSTRSDKLVKSITAVEGTYKIGYRIPLMFDLCYFDPINKKDLVVAYGFYARLNQVTTSSGPDLYDDWKIGLSVNLLQKSKAKYMIGAFVQTGNYTDGKDKKTSFGKTISAGLTLKLNLRTFDYNRVFF